MSSSEKEHKFQLFRLPSYIELHCIDEGLSRKVGVLLVEGRDGRGLTERKGAYPSMHKNVISLRLHLRA